MPTVVEVASQEIEADGQGDAADDEIPAVAPKKAASKASSTKKAGPKKAAKKTKAPPRKAVQKAASKAKGPPKDSAASKKRIRDNPRKSPRKLRNRGIAPQDVVSDDEEDEEEAADDAEADQRQGGDGDEGQADLEEAQANGSVHGDQPAQRDIPFGDNQLENQPVNPDPADPEDPLAGAVPPAPIERHSANFAFGVIGSDAACADSQVHLACLISSFGVSKCCGCSNILERSLDDN